MPGPDSTPGVAQTPLVERVGADFAVDADLIGELLHLPAAEVQTLMRNGDLTSICERGEGEDAGLHRLTFFHQDRRGRLIVDADGRILQRSRIRIAPPPID